MGIPIIGDIINAAKDIISEVVVDKDKKIEANLKLRELELKSEEMYNQQLAGQVEINKVEAAHDSVFVAGWRPFIGWVSGFGVAWTFVVAPFVEWVSRLFGWAGAMPELDTGQLMALVTAMLGVAGYRTYEKVQGVSREGITKKEEPPIMETPLVETPERPKRKKKFKF